MAQMNNKEQAKTWVAKTFDVSSLSGYQFDTLGAIYETRGADIEAMNLEIYAGTNPCEIYISSAYIDYRIYINDTSYNVTASYYAWNEDLKQLSDEPYNRASHYYPGANLGLEYLIDDILEEVAN